MSLQRGLAYGLPYAARPLWVREVSAAPWVSGGHVLGVQALVETSVKSGVDAWVTGVRFGADTGELLGDLQRLPGGTKTRTVYFPLPRDGAEHVRHYNLRFDPADGPPPRRVPSVVEASSAPWLSPKGKALGVRTTVLLSRAAGLDAWATFVNGAGVDTGALVSPLQRFAAATSFEVFFPLPKDGQRHARHYNVRFGATTHVLRVTSDGRVRVTSAGAERAIT